MPEIQLSIAIPTFNRATELERLLQKLLPETLPYVASVEVFVCDNASTDATTTVVERYRKSYPNLVVFRSDENVGMDGNFQRCFEYARGKFLWMIGDDDVPKAGLLSRIVAILAHTEPDLLHIRSKWHPNLTGYDDERLVRLPVLVFDRSNFVKEVNIWLTYISGNITRIDTLKSTGSVQFGEYSNTSLSQLAWIAPAVRHGQIFLATTEAGLLATSENSGGYRLFDVFGNTLAKILQREWDGEAGMRRAVLKASSLHYIPGLLWKTRLGRSGGFSTDGILESLSAYRPFISYWLLIVPIAKLPLSLALFFAIAAKVASLTFSIQRKVLAKLRLGRYARMHAVEY